MQHGNTAPGGGKAAGSGHIILSHGLESGPEAYKITRLAAHAEALGWSCERPDYSALRSPLARLERLLERCAAADRQPLLLVGSSMGAWISALASMRHPVAGLFLLAPPVRMPAGELLQLNAPHCMLVHGWRDELIPPEEVLGFASVRSLPTLMLDDDHRLGASIEPITVVFDCFLRRWSQA